MFFISLWTSNPIYHFQLGKKVCIIFEFNFILPQFFQSLHLIPLKPSVAVSQDFTVNNFHPDNAAIAMLEMLSYSLKGCSSLFIFN